MTNRAKAHKHHNNPPDSPTVSCTAAGQRGRKTEGEIVSHNHLAGAHRIVSAVRWWLLDLKICKNTFFVKRLQETMLVPKGQIHTQYFMKKKKEEKENAQNPSEIIRLPNPTNLKFGSHPMKLFTFQPLHLPLRQLYCNGEGEDAWSGGEIVSCFHSCGQTKSGTHRLLLVKGPQNMKAHQD